MVTLNLTLDLHPSPLDTADDLSEQLLLAVRLVPGDGEAQHHHEVLDGARPAFPDQTVFKILDHKTVLGYFQLIQGLKSRKKLCVQDGNWLQVYL